MGYESAKIYKLECDDGHYYYGSTINELRVRLGGHKTASKKQPYKVYKHINSIGWEKVRILLVEAYPCKSKEELNTKESDFISKSREDPMCLNNNLAFATEEQIIENKQKHNIANKEKLAEYHKAVRTGNQKVSDYQKNYRSQNSEIIKQSKRDYYIENKDEIDKKNKERYLKNRDSVLQKKREKYNQESTMTQ